MFDGKGLIIVQMYDVYSENGTLELIAVIKANSLEEAKEKARVMGYGKEYRIEESWDG